MKRLSNKTDINKGKEVPSINLNLQTEAAQYLVQQGQAKEGGGAGGQQKQVQILERDLQYRQRALNRDKTTSHESCTCKGPLKTLQKPSNHPKTLKNDERTQIQVHMQVSLRKVAYETPIAGSASHVYNTNTRLFSLKVMYG